MKRSIYVTIALIAMIISVFSCKKKGDEVEVVDLPGTTWRYYYSNGENSSEETIHFVNSSIYSMSYKYTGTSIDSGSFSGPYTYTAPNIIIEKLNGNLTGVVAKDALTLEDSNGGVGVYYKQN